jgi:nucleotide-binding universal stress UspA family protein
MRWYRNILIPTDGSADAQAAVASGLDMAKRLNADVTVISIIDVRALISIHQGIGVPDQYAYQQKAADAAAEEVMEAARVMGVRASMIVRRGNPANDIIEESPRHDLIVMGTRGRTGVAHFFLGSVAEKVVRFAACPVLVIRTSRKE